MYHGLSLQAYKDHSDHTWISEWINLSSDYVPPIRVNLSSRNDKLRMPDRHQNEGRMGHDLIKTGTRQWNHELLASIFSRDEIVVISRIRLSNNIYVDMLVWGGERSGVYSVCTGYKQLMPTTNLTNDEQALFKQIWALSCPSKTNLCYIYIATDPLCPRCHLDVEIIEHNHNKKSKIEIAISVWTIWFARNKFYHEGISQSTDEMFTFTCNFGGGSKPEIKNLKNNFIDNFEIPSLICEAQGLASNFLDCVFNFVPRSGNKVVHAIAALGRSDNANLFFGLKMHIHRRLSSLLLIVEFENRLSGIYIERFRVVVKAVWAVVSGGVAVVSGGLGGGVRREAAARVGWD
ncbi:hypothetical protein GQ457_02G028940 [Hibiscus cannabinus]